MCHLLFNSISQQALTAFMPILSTVQLLISRQCDEVQPECGKCQRYQLPCNYDRHNAKTAPEATGPDQANENPPSNDSSTEVLDHPESRTRRLLELRMIHQYNTRTGPSLSLNPPGSTGPDARESWFSNLPMLAFQNDALLNILCATAALHIAVCNPQDSEGMDVHRKYLDMALREHSTDVAHLTKANADATCMTSNFIRTVFFATLQERPLVPYSPPVPWLQMTKGSGNLIEEAWEFIQDDETSLAFRLVQNLPFLTDPEPLFQDSGRHIFRHLLRGTRTGHTLEPWSAEIEEAYSSTLNYITSVQSRIDEGEKPQTLCRLLLAFPYLVKQPFIDLLSEQRPRALVILAHYFAFLTRFRYVWFIGDAGPREIRAIEAILPVEWQDLMVWPLQRLAEEPSFA